MKCAESNLLKVLLDGTFSSYSVPNAIFHVVLIENRGLYYNKLKPSSTPSSNSRELVQFVEPNKYDVYECLETKDMVGCQCMRDPIPVRRPPSVTDTPSSDASCAAAVDIPIPRVAYFCVYSYPLRKQMFGRSLKRQRVSVTFTVDLCETFGENIRIAETWRDAIRCMLHGGCHSAAPKHSSTNNGESSSSNGAILRVPCPICAHQRKLLVLVNPHSGPGKSLKIFQERVVPVLAEAGISFDLIVTDKAKSAHDHIKLANLTQWNGIVIVSGDGLVYEVINGLMERADWSSAIQIPIGVIPGGSGNGLAKAISHASKEPVKTNAKLLAAFNIAKGRITPMDVVRVVTPNAVLYSFLAIGWGIVADIDIESERLRALGGTRFTLWAIARIIDLRVYRGRLSYLPVENYIRTLTSKTLSRAQSTVSEDVQQHLIQARLTPSMSCPADMSEENGDDDDATVDAAAALELAPCEESHHGSTQKTASSGGGLQSEEAQVCGSSQLPPLDEPVPENWIQTEDDFVLVYVAFQSHISTDAFVAPDASLDDGIMWLIIIRKGATRSQLLSFLLALESGNHVNLPFVEVIPVHAFRLVPISEPGYLTVDGERVEYGPIQAEVLNAIARVMSH